MEKSLDCWMKRVFGCLAVILESSFVLQKSEKSAVAEFWLVPVLCPRLNWHQHPPVFRGLSGRLRCCRHEIGLWISAERLRMRSQTACSRAFWSERIFLVSFFCILRIYVLRCIYHPLQKFQTFGLNFRRRTTPEIFDLLYQSSQLEPCYKTLQSDFWFGAWSPQSEKIFQNRHFSFMMLHFDKLSLLDFYSGTEAQSHKQQQSVRVDGKLLEPGYKPWSSESLGRQHFWFSRKCLSILNIVFREDRFSIKDNIIRWTKT